MIDDNDFQTPSPRQMSQPELATTSVDAYQIKQLRQQVESLKQYLKACESRSHRVVNAMPEIVWIADTNGAITYLNQVWFEVTGLLVEASLGKSAFVAVHPEDRDRACNLWQQAVLSQQNYRTQVRLLQADGSYRPFLFLAQPIFGEKNEVIEWVGTATVDNQAVELQQVCERTAQLEASDRQKHQALAREQQARQEAEAAKSETEKNAVRLILAMDAAKMGSWDWDLITNKIDATIHAKRIFGYPDTAEISYYDWFNRIHPDDIPRIQSVLQTAIVNKQDFVAQCRVVWADASIHWINALGRLYYNAQGNPVRMVGMIADITERKLAEDALKESEERFRATFEQAAVGVAHVSLDGRWLRVNQKLCEIVGYTCEELLQLTFADITHPDDLQMDLNYLQQLKAGEIQNYSMEKRYIRKDNSNFWVNITTSLVSENQERPKYFIRVVEDISQRKQTELRLQHQAEELTGLNMVLRQTSTLLGKRNQELDEFVYIVSHDLKAPLRAIASLSEWIEEDLQSLLTEENQQQMQLLRRRVHRMEALINGLLQYSRVGRTEVKAETVDVNALLLEVIDSLAPPAPVIIEVTSKIPTLIAKRLLLSQVFANLIGNALKHHNRADGNIKISAQDQGEYYQFAVSDDGSGIPPEQQEKVFGIFQTLKARDSVENTGIGLSIVKKIVETEGGEITLESDVGKGSTFRFTWLKQPKMPKNES